jgi:hypothetical protein
MSDFIVRFQGIKLNAEQEARVQHSIQKAVLAEVSSSAIAGYTPDPDGSGDGGNRLAYFPLKWRGIIYLPADLRNLSETLTTPLTVTAGNQVAD